MVSSDRRPARHRRVSQIGVDSLPGGTGFEELENQTADGTSVEVGESASVVQLALGDDLVSQRGQLLDVPLQVVGMGADVYHSLSVLLEEVALDRAPGIRLEKFELDVPHLGEAPLDLGIGARFPVDHSFDGVCRRTFLEWPDPEALIEGDRLVEVPYHDSNLIGPIPDARPGALLVAHHTPIDVPASTSGYSTDEVSRKQLRGI